VTQQETQQDLIPLDPSADGERLRHHNADFTPIAVALAGAASALHLLDPKPRAGERLRVLVPFAGTGAHVQAVRALTDRSWPAALTEITAIEVRPEESVRLRASADHVVTGDTFDLDPRIIGQDWDLILDNPPFDRLYDAVTLLAPLLRKGGVLSLLARSAVGQRSPEGWNTWDAQTPAAQMRICGPIWYRDDQLRPDTGRHYQSDLHDYSYWHWTGADDDDGCELDPPRGWATSNIVLPTPLRRACLRQRPGTHGWLLDTDSNGSLALDASKDNHVWALTDSAARTLHRLTRPPTIKR